MNIDRVSGRRWLRDTTGLPPQGRRTAVSSISPNRLLASLAEAHLKTFELRQAAILLKGGQTVEQVCFPHSGIISLVVELSEGMAIEAAMIGRDSMLGATCACATSRPRPASRRSERGLRRRHPRLLIRPGVMADEGAKAEAESYRREMIEDSRNQQALPRRGPRRAGGCHRLFGLR